MIRPDVVEAAMRIKPVRDAIEVIDLVQRGATVKAAASEVGVHENTALSYCRKAGVRTGRAKKVKLDKPAEPR